MPLEIGSGILNAYRPAPHETAVTVPEGITAIAERAFSGCSALSEITLPQSLVRIGAGAFMYCTALEHAVIPAGVSEIAPLTFAGCTALSQVTLPESITAIGENAFRGCAALYGVRLPQGLVSVGNCAFSDCALLRRVEIPAGVRSLAASAFSQGTELLFHLPEGLLRMRTRQFFGSGNDGRLLQQFLFSAQDADARRALLLRMDNVRYGGPIALLMHRAYPQDRVYADYLADHAFLIALTACDDDDSALMRDILETAFLDAADTDTLLSAAMDENETELYAMLANYKAAHFGFSDGSDLRL